MADLDLTRPQTFSHWTEVTIRFSDQDPNQHVNNTAFTVYAEAGRVSYIRALREKFAFREMSALASVHINYRRQLYYPGEVRVGTLLTHLGRKSYTLSQGLFANGEAVATAESVLVFFDYDANESRPVPEALRAGFDAGALVSS